MLRADEFASLDWDGNPSRAQLADVLRVHDFSYVQKLGEGIVVCVRVICSVLFPRLAGKCVKREFPGVGTMEELSGVVL